MPRIDLRDGQWAVIRERITHGQRKAIIRVGQEDDLEFMGAVSRAYVESWEVRDLDGNLIPLDAPDGFDRLPDDIAQAIYSDVVARWRAVTNTVPTPPSSAASS